MPDHLAVAGARDRVVPAHGNGAGARTDRSEIDAAGPVRIRPDTGTAYSGLGLGLAGGVGDTSSGPAIFVTACVARSTR